VATAKKLYLVMYIFRRKQIFLSEKAVLWKMDKKERGLFVQLPDVTS
jgi:hypothetical protein